MVRKAGLWLKGCRVKSQTRWSLLTSLCERNIRKQAVSFAAHNLLYQCHAHVVPLAASVGMCGTMIRKHGTSVLKELCLLATVRAHETHSTGLIRFKRTRERDERSDYWTVTWTYTALQFPLSCCWDYLCVMNLNLSRFFKYVLCYKDYLCVLIPCCSEYLPRDYLCILIMYLSKYSA